MTPEALKTVVELAAATMILLGPVLVIAERWKSGRGPGARSIQLCAVVMLIPTILVLALEKVLEPATVGTLIGALTGYLLSGVGDYRSGKKKTPHVSGSEPD